MDAGEIKPTAMLTLQLKDMTNSGKNIIMNPTLIRRKNSCVKQNGSLDNYVC